MQFQCDRTKTVEALSYMAKSHLFSSNLGINELNSIISKIQPLENLSSYSQIFLKEIQVAATKGHQKLCSYVHLQFKRSLTKKNLYVHRNVYQISQVSNKLG